MDKTAKLIPVINKISECQPPGKKTLQKLVYLMERKGTDLGFNYSIHYYGPYSSDLDYAVHRLEMQGIIEIIPDGKSQRIHPADLSDISDEASIIQELSDQEMNIVNDIIEKFAELSPYDLEVITTTDFVAQKLYKTLKSFDKELIVAGVKTIKGDKFTTDRIKQAISQLVENGYIQ